MSKILISSIGTGSYDREAKTTNYRPANYYLGDENNVVTSAYVYDALAKLRGFDKLILVGTCGSQWHVLYEHLFEPDSSISPVLAKDEEYTYRLLELFERPDKKSYDINEMRTELNLLKDTMGKACAEIFVLNYGINDDELLFNFELMTKMADHIAEGDIISFDITHSFRSLAFFELLSVSYIKDTLKKNVVLDFVSYGMYDFANENANLSPLVDLSRLIRMMDWLKAAEEYKRYGTTALFSDLLANDTLGVSLSKEEQKVLRRLGGDAISTNDIPEFKNLIKNCVNATKTVSDIRSKNIVLDFIFSDMAARFGNKLDDDMLLQVELAKWHFEKKRYIAAAITLIEATLSYCALLAGMEKEAIRSRILNIHSANSDVGNFRERYDTLRQIRNKLSHAQPLASSEIAKLEQYIKAFYTTYKKRFKDIPENESDLRTALRKR
ncbi:hypothetical protein FACS1894167_05030 [Synergistales bacterium]|nr:hypothetical protein FACS1894167_05030 [Synergistales bacterium]